MSGNSSTKISVEAIENIFQAQLNNVIQVGQTTAKERIKKLKLLEKVILESQDEIIKALDADFSKPEIEVLLSEIAIITNKIHFVCRKLTSWMAPKRIKRFLTVPTISGELEYKPKGACLIIAPWNYPFSLAFGPLVYAIAAGNTVILKPSELTQNTANCIESIINKVFKSNEVAVIKGDAEVAQILTALPFNHIFFTGSPQVGHFVMEAAAKNLTSVTLELGGKSPVIVTESANLEIAAKRIVWGKYINAGQTCIAPDYVLVHHSIYDAFILELKRAVETAQNGHDFPGSKFSKIINQSHTKRLISLLDDAKNLGAKVELGGNTSLENREIDFTVLTSISDEMLCMNEEIFGPILPIKKYDDLFDAVNFVFKKPRPLASYIFTKKRNDVTVLSDSIRTGVVFQNDVLLQFGHPYAPFGGINNSGFGNSNGIYGFKAFSHEQPVLKNLSWSPIDLLHPPYTSFHKKILNLVIKWL